jgi:hypothetical protein
MTPPNAVGEGILGPVRLDERVGPRSSNKAALIIEIGIEGDNQ